MWHVCGTGEVCTGFLWGNLKERGRLENLGADRRKTLKCIFKQWAEAWTGLIWLGIWTSGGHL